MTTAAQVQSRCILIEDRFGAAVLAVMCLVPFLEAACRLTLGRGVPGSAPVVQHLTLWVALMGAALAARSNALLALSTADVLPDIWRRWMRIATSAVAGGVTGWLVLASVEMVRPYARLSNQIGFGIPQWLAMLALPLGFSLITLRLIQNASESWRGRALAAVGLLSPALLILAPVSDGSGLWVIGIVAVLLATMLGMPIYAGIGGAALILIWNDATPVSSVPLSVYRIATDSYLPAIPLFTLSGYLLAEGGAGRRLMRTLTAFLGWMPGGLAIAITLILAFFTPLTGASGVTILSMGGLLLPMLRSARYPADTALGLVTVSGSIGLLLPPSLPVILYAIYGSGVGRVVRIDHLFIGALVPGIMLILAVAGWAAVRGSIVGAMNPSFVWSEAGSAAWGSKWELLLPVAVLGGYAGGFFASLVEAAAFTAAYALVVECLVYRDLTLRLDVPRIAVQCTTLVGSFLVILGVALAFNDFLVLMDVPSAAVGWVEAHIGSRTIFLLALNVLLIVVGALMDIYSAIFVVAPLVAPMALVYGIDPVHLGVIFLANMELGYLMPPMGENLFLSAMRFDEPLTRIYRSTLPYVVMLLAVVMLVTYVPSLTLWMVQTFGG